MFPAHQMRMILEQARANFPSAKDDVTALQCACIDRQRAVDHQAEVIRQLRDDLAKRRSEMLAEAVNDELRRVQDERDDLRRQLHAIQQRKAA
jgi:hypothetical protein